MSRGQIPTCQGLDRARKRFPFDWREIHSDNGTNLSILIYLDIRRRKD